MSRDPDVALGANRIRELRNAAGLSQEKLADMVGVSHATIGRLERGKQNTKLSTLTAIADALDVSVSKIVEEPGANTPDRSNVERLIEEIKTSTDAEARMLLEVFRALRRTGTTP